MWQIKLNVHFGHFKWKKNTWCFSYLYFQLGFFKAFDKVDINLVIEKIKCLGIGGKIIEWITSFLKNRQQYVLVYGVLSHPSPVISGVPQGSVLRLLLFLILFGDIEIYYGMILSFFHCFCKV